MAHGKNMWAILQNYKATWNWLLTNEKAKSTSTRWLLCTNRPQKWALILVQLSLVDILQSYHASLYIDLYFLCYIQFLSSLNRSLLVFQYPHLPWKIRTISPHVQCTMNKEMRTFKTRCKVLIPHYRASVKLFKK
jgi:hypothetical protein